MEEEECLLNDTYMLLHKAQTLCLRSQHTGSQSFNYAALKILPIWLWAIDRFQLLAPWVGLMGQGKIFIRFQRICGA